MISFLYIKQQQGTMNLVKQNHIWVQGFLTEIDKYNRAKVMFLDDYDAGELSVPSYSKKYLTQKRDRLSGTDPITSDDKYFYVKCRDVKIGEINGVMCNINDLVQHKVDIYVYVKHYNYVKSGIRYKGWYLDLGSVKLLEM